MQLDSILSRQCFSYLFLEVGLVPKNPIYSTLLQDVCTSLSLWHRSVSFVPFIFFESHIRLITVVKVLELLAVENISLLSNKKIGTFLWTSEIVPGPQVDSVTYFPINTIDIGFFVRLDYMTSSGMSIDFKSIIILNFLVI